ncbi:hypothetical protein HYV10_00510 [Candidatus Dependentiae bacterium]|nr:hypothetical protein [Candidatus Dependentiae bacterium]
MKKNIIVTSILSYFVIYGSTALFGSSMSSSALQQFPRDVGSSCEEINPFFGKNDAFGQDFDKSRSFFRSCHRGDFDHAYEILSEAESGSIDIRAIVMGFSSNSPVNDEVVFSLPLFELMLADPCVASMDEIILAGVVQMLAESSHNQAMAAYLSSPNVPKFNKKFWTAIVTQYPDSSVVDMIRTTFGIV